MLKSVVLFAQKFVYVFTVFKMNMIYIHSELYTFINTHMKWYEMNEKYKEWKFRGGKKTNKLNCEQFFAVVKIFCDFLIVAFC